MKIYNYDKDTKEYIGASEADLDPEETKVQGKNIYLIPAYATDVKPPKTGKAEVAIYDEGWKKVPDYRGLYMVNMYMIPEKVTKIGELEEGYAIITEEQIALLEEKGTNYFIIEDGSLIINPNYEEEEAEKEKARILALSMTRSDFFDGTIKAFRATEQILHTSVETVLAALPISDIEKLTAINNYENALNFYRKHTLFTLLSSMPIPITEELSVTITSEQWDKFFDETNKRNPDAYKELLPKEKES